MVILPTHDAWRSSVLRGRIQVESGWLWKLIGRVQNPEIKGKLLNAVIVTFLLYVRNGYTYVAAQPDLEGTL